MFLTLPRSARNLLLPMLLAGAFTAAHADDAGVTPYRPSVSTPAQLPTPGQLEFEAGFLSAYSDGQHRGSTPVLFKLAFSEQWGVTVGGEAFVSAPDQDGQRVRGFGDTVVTLKRAFVLDAATAFGLELTAKLPTAKDAIGSGKADTTLNTILSRDMGAVHMDANLNFTRLGAYDLGLGRTVTGLASSFSTPVSEQWGATAELSGTRQAGAPSTAQLLLALSYSPSKRMTIDFGLAHGLNGNSTNLSLFSGLVVPLAKLW
jgi:hypothetical protein